MTSESQILRPVLVRHARYRWDQVREQHQVVFPEGLLVLNKTGAEIVQLCDGRLIDEIIAALRARWSEGDPSGDVVTFLDRLARKGLLCNAPPSK